MSHRGNGSVWAQPAFCAVCGAELASIDVLQVHLQRPHALRREDERLALQIARREIACAVLEITDPEWCDPEPVIGRRPGPGPVFGPE